MSWDAWDETARQRSIMLERDRTYWVTIPKGGTAIRLLKWKRAMKNWWETMFPKYGNGIYVSSMNQKKRKDSVSKIDLKLKLVDYLKYRI